MVLALLTFSSCKRLVEIDQPVNSITTEKVFSNDVDATSAMNGIYYDMINVFNANFSNGGITICSGLSSDEFNLFNTSNSDYFPFQQNALPPTNYVINNGFWQPAFRYIYRANAVIEGVQNSTGIHDSVKTELMAEAKFIRAFEYFYLINLFGDVPFVTTINWRNTNLLSRTSVNDIYSSIKADLMDAESNLVSNYSLGNGLRIIPKSFAATALLARVYLYSNELANAEAAATKVINNSSFSLSNNLLTVFSTSSKEAIWQLKQDSSAFYNYSVYEGNILIPKSGSAPFVFLNDSLLKSFEPNDKRRLLWVDSVQYNSVKYYFPRKYRIGSNQQFTAPYSEYYTVLRLAEQYLIRAEARARQNKLSEAISDINFIRQRAGLSSLSGSLTQSQVISAIEQENRIEFFAEWGHRWLDLKRWERGNAVLAPMKGNNWQPSDQLFPIPQDELRSNPNLIQNTGY
jgi:hypothetical protein